MKSAVHHVGNSTGAHFALALFAKLAPSLAPCVKAYYASFALLNPNAKLVIDVKTAAS